MIVSITGQYRPTCPNIGCNRPVAWSSATSDGTKHWRPLCSKCRANPSGTSVGGTKGVKKRYCENHDGHLGFTCRTKDSHLELPDNLMCTLDLDHIDGDHYNNDPDNLQTLCCGCHREKTSVNNDHGRKTRTQKEKFVVTTYNELFAD